jgi:hypothetical protein
MIPDLSGAEARPGGSSPALASDLTFIVGPARSGTSLLYKTLCLHPDAAWISNWVARFPRMWQLAILNRAARAMPARARAVWFAGGSNAYVYGTPRRLADRLFPMPVEGEPVYRTAGVGGSGGSGDDPAGDLLRAFRRLRSFGGGAVLISKRIGNNQRIPFLSEAFPSARFVEVVRDGRAVAYSLSRVDWWPRTIVPWYGGTPADWEADGRDPWELCARNWVEELRAIRAGIQAVPPDRIMRVRYETLVGDPLATVDAVARFVGLGSDRRWRASVAALLFPNRNQAWREALPPAVVDGITEVQRELLDELGYLDGTASHPRPW